MMRTRGLTSVGVIALALALALALAVAFVLAYAPAALALRAHTFETSFGSAGSGPGQFEHPAGVAVNEATGDVYVLDRGNDRVERFSATGVYLGQFNGSGEYEVEGKKETGIAAGRGGHEGEIPTGQFSFEPSSTEGDASIAVDNSCYVRHLSESACTEQDPSNGDVYVVDPHYEPGNQGRRKSVVDKFGPEGAYRGQIAETVCEQEPECEPGVGGEPTVPDRGKFAWATYDDRVLGVAVDASGALWVYWEWIQTERLAAEYSDAAENAYIATSNVTFHTIFGEPGFAVGCKDDLFALRREGVSVFGHQQAFSQPPTILAENLLAEAQGSASGVATELPSCDAYVDETTFVARFLASDFSVDEIEQFQVPGGGGAGLAVNPGLESVYVADAEADVVDVFGPEPPGAPRVLGTSVSEVGASGAKLEALVEPHGAETRYVFEYGRCASLESCAGSGYEHRVPEPEGAAGSGYEREAVSVAATGLVAGVNYHFRVVAHNEIKGRVETVFGEEWTFTTQPVGAFGLLDGRAWELVSPASKRGAAVLAPFEGQEATQAAAGGGAFTFVTTAPTEAQPQGFTNFMQVLSRRGVDGWSSQDIGIPHLEATGQGLGDGMEYRAFSDDLSLSVVQPFGGFDPLLSEEASGQTAFLRSDFESGTPEGVCTKSCYRPLVTGCPGEGEECAPVVRAHEDVPAGTVFGTAGKCPPKQFTCGPQFVGGSPDLSSIVLSSGAALTGSKVENGLYEWSAGRLRPVSVLPAGEGERLVGGRLGAELGSGVGVRMSGAVSENGSRIVWTSSSGALYMRDMVAGEEGETVRLDAVRGGSGEGKAQPIFELASADGSRVFFTDTQRLTPDSGAGSTPPTIKPDLYECEMLEKAGGGLECKLSDLTPAHGGEGADVQGAIIGASEDGSWVYFVAAGVLAENADQAGEKALPGAENLYVAHDGTSTFIATLSAADGADWADPDNGGSQNAYMLTARVSPDGGWLAFMSGRSLTGYDNRDLLTGKPDEEVYLYDAQAGRLVCASCDPTGQPPTGFVATNEGSTGAGKLILGVNVWLAGQGIAASVPGWTTPFDQPRYLSNGGRLFFDGFEALVPQDVNGTWDVYEYEPAEYRNGEGSVECTSESVSFSERSGGCVGLVSSGESSEESAFLDASESGSEAFFLTAAKLVPQDFDSSYDVYDARECTAGSPCAGMPPTQPAPCSTEASCRPAPTPQPEVFGAPASATFSAPAGLAPAGSPSATGKRIAKCKKPKRLSHGRCIKPKEKKKRPRTRMSKRSGSVKHDRRRAR
jgi:DNA-binding beta-propeller fold protein YncE